MHISIAGNWASNSLVFAISHGPRAAAPSTPSQCPTLPRHAVVPSRFRVQVRRVTQRLPPSEPLLSARAIQRRVRRRNFPMHAALLRSGVLRRLRHDPMPTAGVTPAHHPAGYGVGQGGTGSFPTFTDVRCDGVGVQLYPGGIATGRTSQSWPGPPAAQITQTTGAGRSRHTTCPAPQSDPSTRFSRSLTTHGASATGSVSLRLSVLARGHEPSGSSGPPLHCRGCSRPHP